MKLIALAVGSALVALPSLAQADPVAFKPLIDLRIREEHVDQDGINDNADAVTARLRAGFQLSTGHWAVLAEGEGLLAIDNDYNSTTNRRTRYPLVADPQNVELNRLQLQYTGLPKTTITAGRQRIALDDQRFVGPVGWRQNEQTFDAARVESGILGPVKLDATYVWSIRTIYGIDGAGARPQAIGGDQVFVNAALKLGKFGALTGFGYLIDEDEALLINNSSQTYGARFAGTYAFTPKVKLAYAASFARQYDYKRNTHDYHADYYLGDASLNLGGPMVGGGYEVLGAANGGSGGIALTSFQTPLATLHKFQGWADKFLMTPPNGVRDLYGSAGYVLPKYGRLSAITAQVVYHRFRSDRLGLHYGHEWDALLSAKVGRVTALAKYADYRANQFATDTKKFWVELDYVL